MTGKMQLGYSKSTQELEKLFGLLYYQRRSSQHPKKVSSLVSGWFSSSRFTEQMKRGTANEGAVMRSMQKEPL